MVEDRCARGASARWRARALAFSLVYMGTACSNSEPYRLGIVLGSEGQRGAVLAVESINAAGGVNGHPLELRDLGGASSGSAQVALLVAESLATDRRVLAVIGHANSSASLAASQVYNARHLVQVAPTTTTPHYSQAGPYSFRLVGSDEHQARFLADTIAAARPSRIAIVYVNDDYGRVLRRLLAEELQKHGMRSVYDSPYSEDEKTDGGELVTSLAKRQPTMLVWLGRATFFAQVAGSLRAALPNVAIVASDGFGGSMVDRDSSGFFQGVRHVRLVDLERPDSILQRARAAYRAKVGNDITDQAVLSYDAVRLLAQAIREAGPNRDAIRDWLSHLGRGHAPFAGVTGPIAFSRGGDRDPHFMLTTIRRRASPAGR